MKSTGKNKKTKKNKMHTHRLRVNTKLAKKEPKMKPEGKDFDYEQKENRPLQYRHKEKVNLNEEFDSMNSNRINRFYKTQRKILLEEGIIEDLQSNFRLYIV